MDISLENEDKIKSFIDRLKNAELSKEETDDLLSQLGKFIDGIKKIIIENK